MLPVEELSSRIPAAAIEVHREFGPGLLESAYERCPCRELELAGIPFHCLVPLPAAIEVSERHRERLVWGIDGTLCIRLIPVAV